MTTSHRLPAAAVLLAIAATVVACSSGGAGLASGPADPATPAAVVPPPAESTVVEAVSARSDSADQVAASDACLITDSKHQLVSSFGFKGLKGAAKVTPARDLAKYVPLWGTEPEIDTDDPAWVFWFDGVVTIPIDITERDPVCVVVNGESSWFSVGASYIDDKWVEAKPPPGGGPTQSLPAIQP